MAISSYKKNGVELFRASVQARGKVDSNLRLQRSKKNIATLKEALKIEKKLLKSVIEEVAKLEGRGLTWGEIVDRWEIMAGIGHLGDKYQDSTITKTHINRLRRYTRVWWDLRASDLTKGDGRQALNAAKANGAGTGLLKNIKSSINVVFNWAIEEKYVLGVSSSPVEGLIVAKKEEKVPKILTKEELRTLLRNAKLDDNPWYPIWSFAVCTGMRSGELMGLQWKDIDLEKGIITVSKSYNNSRRIIKSTKAGYWRSVPISNDLRSVIMELKNDDTNPEDFVLERHYAWKNGQAGAILRQYLKDLGIDSDVVFHTLRACFATHLLASGVDQATVMKIGGWRDIKTFQIYVRLAGIEVKGATDALDVMPQMDTITGGKVVNMSEFMGRS